MNTKTNNLNYNGLTFLKPGFIHYRNEWIQELNKNNWTILKEKKMKLTQKQICSILGYPKELANKHLPEIDKIINYYTSDYIICFLLYKDCKNPYDEMYKLKSNFRQSRCQDPTEHNNVLQSTDDQEDTILEAKLLGLI